MNYKYTPEVGAYRSERNSSAFAVEGAQAMLHHHPL